jgi:hypothetical protein
VSIRWWVGGVSDPGSRRPSDWTHQLDCTGNRECCQLQGLLSLDFLARHEHALLVGW